MNPEVQKLKHSFWMSIFWIVLLLVAVTGSTYAWFTFAGRTSTNVTPMGGSISEGDAALLISNASGGPFDKTCDLVLTGNPESLSPVSTSDLQHFFTAAAQNKEGITVLYQNVDARVDQAAVHGTVYLKCQNAPCNVYFDRENLKLGSDGQALAAMRLGLRITSNSGTQTFLFQLNSLGATGNAQTVRTIAGSSAVVSAISGNGQPSYVDDPALDISEFMAQAGANENEYKPGARSLVSLQADEVATVEYYLYLEGCDEQCSNAVQRRSSELALAFAGVDAKSEQEGESG